VEDVAYFSETEQYVRALLARPNWGFWWHSDAYTPVFRRQAGNIPYTPHQSNASYLIPEGIFENMA